VATSHVFLRLLQVSLNPADPGLRRRHWCRAARGDHPHFHRHPLTAPIRRFDKSTAQFHQSGELRLPAFYLRYDSNSIGTTTTARPEPEQRRRKNEKIPVLFS
jgi:hypothetical protein